MLLGCNGVAWRGVWRGVWRRVSHFKLGARKTGGFGDIGIGGTFWLFRRADA